ARAGALSSYNPSYFDALPDDVAWTEQERLVERASRLWASGDLAPLADVDDALAAIDKRNPLYDAATRLRAHWRVNSGDVARAKEAIALMDGLLVRHRATRNYLLRVAAAVAAGERDVAWPGIQHIAAGGGLRSPNIARSLYRMVRTLGIPPEDMKPVASSVARAARAAREAR
ncbi:MAG: hypothetical protein AAGC67_16775, partial [Myxococcota bacterium]